MRLFLLLVCLAALCAASPVQGQVLRTVNVQLSVPAPPLTGGGERHLEFGSVAPGGTASTGAGREENVNTAKWRFDQLRKNSAYTLDFTLPTQLTRAGGGPLTITYPENWGRWCTYPTADARCSQDIGDFTPSASFTVTATTSNVGIGNNNRTLEVWIGGELGVPANARAGSYVGTMSLVIAGPGV